MSQSRLKSFKAHCARRGFELLRDDYLFIDKILNKFKITDFKAILERYLEEWGYGMGEAKIFSTAQGFGRKRANLWMLRYASEAGNLNMAKEASKVVTEKYHEAIENLK